MAQQDAVFVVGLARSGTTALRNTLHQLPAFRGLRPKSIETRVFYRSDLIPSVRKHRMARPFYIYMLKNEEQVDRMLASLREVRFALPGVREALARRVSSRSLAWRLRANHHRVRIFFHYAQQARKSSRILEKTPRHVHFMEEIFATFPRARVVLCIRHPVEAYSSVRKRLDRDVALGRSESRLEWLRATPEQYARHYQRVVRAELHQLRARPDQTLLLRYEDLTRNPEESLRRVCEFVGEPFAADALLGAEEARDSHGSPVKGSRIAANTKLWGEWVDADEARRIEDEIGEDLGQLGYSRYTEASSPGETRP